MVKDSRYATVKKLIEAGATTSLSEILQIIPKTVIGHDLGMHHQTFNKLTTNPVNFTLKDIFHLAALIGVDERTMLKLVVDEALKDGKRKNKASK